MWKHLESYCSFTGTHPQTVVDSFASTSVFILCLLLIQVIPGVSGALTTMYSTKAGPQHSLVNMEQLFWGKWGHKKHD